MAELNLEAQMETVQVISKCLSDEDYFAAQYLIEVLPPQGKKMGFAYLAIALESQCQLSGAKSRDGATANPLLERLKLYCQEQAGEYLQA